MYTNFLKCRADVICLFDWKSWLCWDLEFGIYERFVGAIYVEWFVLLWGLGFGCRKGLLGWYCMGYIVWMDGSLDGKGFFLVDFW